MQSLALENYGAIELSFDEQKETEGGFFPVVVAVGWAVMGARSIVALGFRQSAINHGKQVHF
ncbi:MAG: hypothetical protein U5M51_07170 [Emticicia sp.]|nr:hypothetical protein [Emticicia sp.]